MRKIYPGMRQCLASDCKHNCRFVLNVSTEDEGKDCLLKEVSIYVGGKCNSYQPRKELSKRVLNK